MNRVWDLITKVKRLWWKASFQKHCKTMGSELTVQGPTVVFGGGWIEAGNHLVIRATPHLPVEIYAAAAARLSLGRDVFINQGVRISCSNYIEIGDGCLIADECVLLDNDFHAAPGQPVKVAPVILEAGVWLATRVIVLRGVTIGKGSRIGAGSVVTRSIPAGCFAAGVPARVIRSLSEDYENKKL